MTEQKYEDMDFDSVRQLPTLIWRRWPSVIQALVFLPGMSYTYRK